MASGGGEDEEEGTATSEAGSDGCEEEEGEGGARRLKMTDSVIHLLPMHTHIIMHETSILCLTKFI